MIPYHKYLLSQSLKMADNRPDLNMVNKMVKTVHLIDITTSLIHNSE